MYDFLSGRYGQLGARQRDRAKMMCPLVSVPTVHLSSPLDMHQTGSLPPQAEAPDRANGSVTERCGVSFVLLSVQCPGGDSQPDRSPMGSRNTWPAGHQVLSD